MLGEGLHAAMREGFGKGTGWDSNLLFYLGSVERRYACAFQQPAERSVARPASQLATWVLQGCTLRLVFDDNPLPERNVPCNGFGGFVGLCVGPCSASIYLAIYLQIKIAGIPFPMAVGAFHCAGLQGVGCDRVSRKIDTIFD